MAGGRRRRSLAVVLLVTLATTLPAWVVQAGAPGTITAGLTRHGEAARARTLAFWTPARMRAAVPRDLALTGDGTVEPGAYRLGIGYERGAEWPDGLGRAYRATGKAFFRLGSQTFVCSGSVLADTSTLRSLVLTAGHCVYDFSLGFAMDWLFIPEYDAHPGACGQTSYGCWTATWLVVHQGFATAPGFNLQAVRHDFAVAVVQAGDRGTQLDTTVGTFRLTTTGTTGDKRYAFGYPAADAYTGNTDLIYCADRTFTDSQADGLTWGVRCNMTGGASGGPWFSHFDPSTGFGRITSLNSYGYPDRPGLMFGPKFNQDTLDVVNAARTTNQSRIVP